MGQYYKAVVIDREDNIIGSFEPDPFEEGLKLMEHSYVGVPFIKQVEAYLLHNPQRIAWSGDYDTIKGYYSRSENGEGIELPTQDTTPIKGRHCIVNHTKKCAVVVPEEVQDKLVIHPLPLLTAMGNGKGGGDYFGSINADKVGTWATDLIEVAYLVPEDYDILKITFKEE